ncbi:MAG: MATE family efflux transporter [Thermotogae bacterium]|uniref:MATE family efflux transporter n=1 Tax=Kosmotoga sp. TaxID=1955248 RepID=UPI000F0E2C62|nr:MATE family efflux transporter [Kosmotoga sp.]MCD6159880.1 MATE family efflux transporter [Kosmotoga sp.]RKX49017.1 MAG: MATE family efflux transporter [Thermotogota bacterium]
MNRVDVLNEDMTTALFKLAWPAVLSMLFQTLYNIVDAFWLGKLGKLEISAPTIAWPVIFLVLSIGGGITVASLALVAQYTGKGEHELSKRAAGQTLSVVFSFAIVVGILGGVFSGEILQLMKIPAEMIPYTKRYMSTIFFGTPFAFGIFAVNSIFIGWGDAITPMRITAISVLLNAVLDPLMIFGIGFPPLGVFGAALSTVISRGAVLIYALYLLFSGKKGFSIGIKHLIPSGKMIRKILKIGLPSSLGNSVTSFAFLIVTAIIARYGAVATAAVGVGNRVTSLATMFSFGLAQATSTMVGQYLGADEKAKAYRVVWKSSGWSMLIVGVVCTLTFFFGREVTMIFINEPDVLVEGTRYFKIVSLSIPFFATFNIFDAALRGAGHTVLSMIVNISRLWVIRIPLIYFFGASMGITGIWYAMLISNLAIATIAALMIISKVWLRKVV